MTDVTPRSAACLGGEDHDTLSSNETLVEYLFRTNERASVTVAVPKETDTTRIGISLRPDMPARAVVHVVAIGSPATELIAPYDELLSVGGSPCESAVQAVKLIREAPAGLVEIVKLPCPTSMHRAASAAQNSLRSAVARREGLSRRVVVKPTPTSPLGISFEAAYSVHSVIAMVKEDGLAASVLKVGDCVRRLNGVECNKPAETAKALRDSSGRLELLIVPAGQRDQAAELEQEEAAQYAAEEAARREAEEAAYHASMGQGGEDEDDEDYEGEEEEEDEDEDEAVAAVPPRAAGVGHDPFPSRPPAIATGGARRLPPSLSSLSKEPSPCANSPPQLVPSAGVPPVSTSSTRPHGPPLAAGTKPHGWREWLAQRRTGTMAVAPRADPEPMSQRV